MHLAHHLLLVVVALVAVVTGARAVLVVLVRRTLAEAEAVDTLLAVEFRTRVARAVRGS
jgi:hypothetical protein